MKFVQTLRKTEEALVKLYKNGPDDESDQDLPLVTFIPSQNQSYGFDAKDAQSYTNDYEHGNILSEVYLAPWKAVAVGQTDPVAVKLSMPGEDNTEVAGEWYDKIVFKKMAATQAAVAGPEERTIRVNGLLHQQAEPLEAYYQYSDGSGELVGKLNVVAYDRIQKKLIIVPVNGYRCPYPAATIQQELNNIFGQAAVNWQVTIDPDLPVESIRNKKFEDGGTGLLSKYTGHMKEVFRVYENKRAKIDKETMYIFLVGNAENTRKEGFMPPKKNCGFLFIDQLAVSDNFHKVLAHELGHGAFHLKHPWSEKYIPEGSQQYNNLMDYTRNGTRLHKYQWDLLHNPAPMLGLFQGEDEGAYAGVNPLLILKSSAEGTVITEQVGNTLSEILKYSRVITQKELLVQRLLTIGKFTSASAVFVACMLYSPDLGHGKPYEIHQDFRKKINDYQALVDVPSLQLKYLNCELDEREFQKLNTNEFLNIAHDHAVYEASYKLNNDKSSYVALQEIDIVPISLTNHINLQKANAVGDLFGGHINKYYIKRKLNYNSEITQINHANYTTFVQKQLDRIPSQQLTSTQAFDLVRQLMCQLRKKLDNLGPKNIGGEQNYYQERPFKDGLYEDFNIDEEILIYTPDDLAELRRLEYLYYNDRESLSEEELNHYFWLKCSIEGDCFFFDPAKYEKHHIIPQEKRIKEHLIVQYALLCDNKFLFNGEDNLISLEKYNKETDQGRHGSHPKYNDWVFKLLEDALRDFRDKYNRAPSPCEAKDELMGIKDYLYDIITNKDKYLRINKIGEKYLSL